MKVFDERVGCGSWRRVPVPAFLADARWALRFELGWAAGLAALLVVGGLLMQGPTNGRFLSPEGLTVLWTSSVTLALAALGAAVVIGRGGLDLSTGAVAALAGLATARYGGAAAGLTVAVACGVLNGVLTAVLRVPGWLATALTGLAGAILLQDLRGSSFAVLESEAPSWILPASATVLLATAVALVGFQVLRRRAGSPLSGGERLTDFLAYVFSGLAAGLAGIFQVWNVHVLPTRPLVADWRELLPALLLGGVWFRSGRTNALAVVLGALTVSAVGYGFVLADLPVWAQYAVLLPVGVGAAGLSFTVHRMVARAYLRRRGAVGPEAESPADPRLVGFDPGLARGPWPLLPVPAFLADRRAALRFQLTWAGGVGLLAAALLAEQAVLFLGSLGNVGTLWHMATPVVLVGLGAALVAARGGFDLSAPAVAMLAGVVAVKTGSAALGFGAAVGCGLVCALAVAMARVPGWIITAACALAVRGECTIVTMGMSFLQGEEKSWATGAGTAAVIACFVGALLLGRLAPRQASTLTPRDRLADGLPYLFSAAAAGLAGLHGLWSLGLVPLRGSSVNLVDMAAVVVIGGTWLGSGRPNVLGALLAALWVTLVRLQLLLTGAQPDSSNGDRWVGLAVLIALVASAVVHAAVARAHARREARPSLAVAGDAGP